MLAELQRSRGYAAAPGVLRRADRFVPVAEVDWIERPTTMSGATPDRGATAG